MIDAGALTAWLDSSLGRSELSASLRDILADEALDDDTRLLHFARLLLPADKMPPVWRGEVINKEFLASQASASLQGDEEASVWLNSCCDGRCFSFYSPINTEIRQLSQEYSEGIRLYREAWRSIVDSGAPPEAVPDESRWISEVAMLTFSEEAAQALRDSASAFFDPATLLSRSGWYFTFGSDLSAMSVYQLRVLEVLEHVSLLDPLNTDSLDDVGNFDEEELRNRVVVPEWQRRLVRGLIIRPGSRIVSLAQGGRHRSREPNSLPEHVAHFLLRTFDSVSDRWRSWREERAEVEPEESVSEEEAAELTIDMRARLIRVTADFSLPDESVVDDEYYLALFIWQAPEDYRVSFRLNELGLVIRPTILKARNLPQTGQLQILLYKGCYATICAKRHWYQPALKTRPIRVYIDDLPKLSDGPQDLSKKSVSLAEARSTTFRLHKVSASRRHLYSTRAQVSKRTPTLEKCSNKLVPNGGKGIHQPAT